MDDHNYKKVKLILFEGDEKGKELPLDKDIIRIGREEDCDICILSDSTISRLQAELRYEDSDYFVYHLGSNPTYVNKREITKVKVKLRHNDVIQVGANSSLQYQENTQETIVIEEKQRRTLFRNPRIVIGFFLYFLLIVSVFVMLSNKDPEDVDLTREVLKVLDEQKNRDANLSDIKIIKKYLFSAIVAESVGNVPEAIKIYRDFAIKFPQDSSAIEFVLERIKKLED